MPKIALIGNYSVDSQYSMQSFLNSISAHMHNLGIEIHVIKPVPFIGRYLKNVNSGMGKWLAYLDKYLFFLPQLYWTSKKADLIHICDQGNGIYVSQLRTNTPVLVTCHDLFAIRASMDDPAMWTLSRTGKIYQNLIWKGIRNAPHITCVSEATKADLLRLLSEAGENVKQVSCIPNSLYKPVKRLGDAESQELLNQCDIDASKPFLLHVGGNQPYKNRVGLVRLYSAMCRLDEQSPPLVLAGKKPTAELQSEIAKLQLNERIIIRTGLSDLEIQALYTRATALIFPSLCEGFGLPILEAQACGCPVFTSNRAPMTEAGKEAACYFDPDDIEGAAKIILETLKDRETMEQMRIQGQENIQAHFQTSRMIAEYAALYRAILAKPGEN